MKITTILGLGAFLMVCGCKPNETTGYENYDSFIDLCRSIAIDPIPTTGDTNDVDWMVHPCTVTTQEFKSEYKVVYADKQYLSFYCTDYSYTGGAHGSTKVTVGTIDRKTGKVLTLSQVPAFADEKALKQKLHDAVVAKIGKESLLGEVKVHNNFYLAKDGWHFVFNEYEVACYALGAIEVVIKE